MRFEVPFHYEDLDLDQIVWIGHFGMQTIEGVHTKVVRYDLWTFYTSINKNVYLEAGPSIFYNEDDMIEKAWHFFCRFNDYS